MDRFGGRPQSRSAERRGRSRTCVLRTGRLEPTVTDANLVSGYLNPDYFLGGEIILDAGAARAAIEKTCAMSLGLSIERAALGIVEIANAAMVNALHLISVQRGEDPRDLAG